MHPLRETQKGYQDRLDQIDRQIANHKKGIDTLAAQRKDIESAKAGIDKLVNDLPAEPKPKAPAKKPAA